MQNWQPSSDISALRARAQLLSSVRQFFEQRQVLEVETPLLAAHCVSDPHIEAIAANVNGQQKWLQTSPEFAMKRLLAAASGSIFQICKAFRNSESGRFHNTEFTILEWYRVGFSLSELIAEVAELLLACLAAEPHANGSSHKHSECNYSTFTYAELFQQHLGMNPHIACSVEIEQIISSRLDYSAPASELSHDAKLDLLFSHCVQPHLQALSFVRDYPATQAALASLGIDESGQQVAKRFECFFKGVELANGYDELLDADEYRQRHSHDNQQRSLEGKTAVECDERFYAAMKAGLPACSGVALGLDRVLQLQLGLDSLAQGISFSDGMA